MRKLKWEGVPIIPSNLPIALSWKGDDALKEFIQRNIDSMKGEVIGVDCIQECPIPYTNCTIYQVFYLPIGKTRPSKFLLNRHLGEYILL